MSAHLRAPANLKSRSQQSGFSLFELLVYLLIASILFAAAANRYQGYPAEAERANFLAVLSQLKAGVNLQMMRMIASADWTQARQEAIAGTNPMDLMLETPSNYLGEFATVDAAALPQRVWYFDSSAGELVYIAENSDNLYIIQDGVALASNQIRLRIENVYDRSGIVDDPDTADNRGRWQGLMLAPVIPYEWRSQPLEQLVADAP